MHDNQKLIKTYMKIPSNYIKQGKLGPIRSCFDQKQKMLKNLHKTTIKLPKANFV